MERSVLVSPLKPSYPLEAFSGDGVFETLRTHDGRLTDLDAHLQRFQESARTIGAELPLSLDRLRSALERAVARRGAGEQMVRLMLIRPPRLAPRIEWLIQPLRSYPRSWYREGAWAITVPGRRASPASVDPRVKDSNRLWGVAAWLDRPDRRLAERLMLSADGQLAEGTVSNLFLVLRDRLWTPAVHAGILAGVSRRRILELAPTLGLAVEEQPLTRHDLYNAQEAFLTSALMDILPLTNVDGRRIGTGRPGSWTRRLHRRYHRWLRECL